MKTATVKYLGNLRTEAQHLKSGNKIITDAPTDNHGKGEAFTYPPNAKAKITTESGTDVVSFG